MAKYRINKLLTSESATTAATKTIDIDSVDPISRILVQIKGTNNGSTPTAHGAKMVSKIELVDGSDVLHSTSGIENQAAIFYERNEMPFMVNEYRNDVSNIQTFEINFGRWLWDEALALDPNRFRNLQLKITHNKANGGSSPDAATLSVFSYEFDEKKITPRGFLMTKEFFTYSLTSNAVQRVDLPVDHPYRLLIVQSLSGGKQPWEQFNKVKLYTDNGKKILINDESTSDLLKLFHPSDRIVESIEGTGTGSAVDHYVTPTYDTYGVVEAFDSAVTTSFVNQSYGGTAGISHDNAEHFQSVFNGLAPHGALALQLWDKDVMEDFFAAPSHKAVRMDLTAGSSVGSSSTCEIVLQQVRMY